MLYKSHLHQKQNKSIITREEERNIIHNIEKGKPSTLECIIYHHKGLNKEKITEVRWWKSKQQNKRYRHNKGLSLQVLR